MLFRSKIRRYVKIEGLGQLRHFRLGGTHLQLSVVLVDLHLYIVELPAGALDLGEIVLITLLVKIKLGAVLLEFRLHALEFESELACGRPVVHFQIALDFCRYFIAIQNLFFL